MVSSIINILKNRISSKVTELKENIYLDKATQFDIEEVKKMVINDPFRYVIIDNFLSKEYSEGIGKFLRNKLKAGLSKNPRDNSKFHPFFYRDRTYDGYRYTPSYEENIYFDFFLSKSMISYVSSIFGIRVNNKLSIAAHFHPVGDKSGWVHNDHSINSFLKSKQNPNGLTIGGNQYFESDRIDSNLLGLRTIAFIYYINNEKYRYGDGGETGLFRTDSEDSLFKKVEPLDNRMLIFETSSNSYHAFLENTKERFCIVGFLFSDIKNR